GPEPIADGSSPGTSEIASVTSLAGCASLARRPPLMRERCLRTVLISPMAAPERKSARVTACLSANERPSAGAIQLAEAPPDIRPSGRLGAPALRGSPGGGGPPKRPAAGETGGPASIIRTRRRRRP